MRQPGELEPRRRGSGILVAALSVGTAGTGCRRDEASKPAPPPRSQAAAASERPLRVAAAADLGPAFEELARRFETSSGRHVLLTFGASGQLARQIAEGAPFDLFAAAD